MSPQDLPKCKHWYQPHFDVLTHFGVWSSGSNSTIFKISNSPSVGNQTVCASALKCAPLSKELQQDIRTAVPDDAFVGDALQAVLDSDDNLHPEIFVDDNHLLCFRQSENVVPRVVSLLNVREQFCERLMVTVSWRVRVTQELIVQQHP